MRKLVRENLRFFAWVTAAGLLLRLLFVYRFPGITNDSLVYADIAKNWLQHGIYGLSGPHEISPTDIRLPGYPAFLAAAFSLFGTDHYRAVFFIQKRNSITTNGRETDSTPRFSKPSFVFPIW